MSYIPAYLRHLVARNRAVAPGVTGAKLRLVPVGLVAALYGKDDHLLTVQAEADAVVLAMRSRLEAQGARRVLDPSYVAFAVERMAGEHPVYLGTVGLAKGIEVASR